MQGVNKCYELKAAHDQMVYIKQR